MAFEDILSCLDEVAAFSLTSARGGGGLTGLFASSRDQSSKDWFLGGGGGFPGLAVIQSRVEYGNPSILEILFKS